MQWGISPKAKPPGPITSTSPQELALAIRRGEVALDSLPKNDPNSGSALMFVAIRTNELDLGGRAVSFIEDLYSLHEIARRALIVEVRDAAYKKIELVKLGAMSDIDLLGLFYALRRKDRACFPDIVGLAPQDVRPVLLERCVSKLDSLSDPRFLSFIAKNSPDIGVRSAAVAKIEDEVVLRTLLNSNFEDVRIAAADKLAQRRNPLPDLEFDPLLGLIAKD